MSMEEEQAKRAEALKAKIAERNKARKARRAAGGSAAVAEAEQAAKSNGAGGNGQTAPAKAVSKEEKVGASPKKKPAKKAAKSKSQKRRVKVTTKGAKASKKATKKAVSKASTGKKANGRVMDRNKDTGLRPIEEKIIDLCKKSKKALQIRVIAESLFGVKEVEKADAGKDNQLIRQIRNNVRRPVELGVLERTNPGFIGYTGLGNIGKAASKKAKSVAKRATGKRA